MGTSQWCAFAGFKSEVMWWWLLCFSVSFSLFFLCGSCSVLLFRFIFARFVCVLRVVLLRCQIWCGVVVGGGGGWWFLACCLLLVGLVLAELPTYFGSGGGFDLVVG
jgi:hypothetical protein